ncbi:MAG: hypothetical protein N2257_09105 [Thermodesulfovibrionales bacterium]|nr:hypothetical protein [Thermodesulfovibrionales bacterium]
MSFFEILMVICFGAAWPFSIVKSLKTKDVSGKSPVFLFIVLAGYISGIIHKILYSYDAVIFIYIINALMVAIDTAIYFQIKKKWKMF